MNLKTYRAPSMAQALAEVKKDLGKDAVILHTRAYKVGAVMGIGGRQVIEVTAADQMSARGPTLKSGPASTAATATAPRPPRRPATPLPEEFIADAFTKVEAPAAVGETPTVQVRPVKVEDLVSRTSMTLPPRGSPPAATPTEPAPATDPAPRDPAKVGVALLDHLYNPASGTASGTAAPSSMQPPAARDAERPTTTPPAVARLTTKVPFAPVSQSAMLDLHTELASIKRLVGQVLQCSRSTAASVSPTTGAGLISMAGVSDPLLAIYLRLQEAGVAPAIGEELVGAVRDELTPDELAAPDVVRQSMLRAIAARIPVVGSMSRVNPQEGGRPLTIALVGPTGVGKTTTIAKLAAAYKLRQGKKVGLITSDTYRIAAVDQLRVYANIIGLPLKVVMTPREMAAACGSMADHDVILIDTAGRSQHDATRLDELRSFIEASSPHETHLVLSATVAEPVLAKAADKFGALEPSRVIFSKLDEAVSFGVLLNVMHGRKLRVSYVTTGQEVPDQIELAQADRLARLVLEGELV